MSKRIWVTVTDSDGAFSEWYVPEGAERAFWKVMGHMESDDKIRQA